MAFRDAQVNIEPGRPAIVVVQDNSVTSAAIAASAYWVRSTALATQNDPTKDYAAEKRYEGVAGAIRQGRGRDGVAGTVGALIVGVGNNDPVLKRGLVSTDANGVDTVTIG